MKSRNEIGLLLNERGLTGNGVEVGVFGGAFSEKILGAWRGSKLFLIDAWRFLPDYHDSLYRKELKVQVTSEQMTPQQWDAVYQECVSRTRRFGDRVEIKRMTSMEAVGTFPDAFFDFIYIDANHSTEGVTSDLIAWFPKLKSGGMFSGHDYYNGEYRGTMFGVKTAVDAFAKQKGKQIVTTSEPNTLHSWYFFK